MTDNRGAADEEHNKLLKESERSADDQIVWLGLVILGILALSMFGLSRCGGGVTHLVDDFGLGNGGDDSSIALALDDDSDLNTSASFFESSDLERDLADGDRGPFTVFAPSDDAWNAAGIDLDKLSDDDIDEGADFHIVQGRYTLDQLQDLGTVTTLGGYDLVFADDMINGAVSVEHANIEADNGLVHKIDGLFPADETAVDEPVAEPTPAPEPTATSEPEPTPVPEPTATPEPEPTAVPTPEPAPEPEPAFTIANLAGDTPDLSILTGLVGDLGLDAMLADADAGPFTVFAPTNGAFESAADLVASLSDGDVESTVGYHVVGDLVPASAVVPGARFETLSGETLVIGGDGSLPGGVNVLSADLETDNGVVHVIDGVLVPAPILLRNLTASIAALDGIQFDVGSATIRPESEEILNQAAGVLRSLPDGTLVEVAGHTDSDGGAELNQSLSEARANSVVAYLIGQNVDGNLLTAVGYGEADLLVDPETSDADKQANRRIEFVRPS